MKLLKQHIDKDGSGFVTLKPEYDEDMWHAYNLIQQGDHVRASAVRRIVSESSTGSTESHRIKLVLTIRVDKVIFSAANSAASSSSDPSSSSTSPATAASASASDVAALHLSGPVVSESPHVKMGAFHTLDLELNRDFTLIKAQGEWDSINKDRIHEATQLGGSGQAEVGAIIAGDGIANICLITQHTTLVRQRIDVPVPKKRKGGGTALGAERATSKFHQQLYAAVTRHFDLDQLKVIIIASPGFVKESIMASIMEEAQRTNNKPLLQAKPRFMLLHASSHHVHALSQLLSSPEVSARLKDTKFAREGQALDRFNRMLATDELRAWYGEEHVLKAAERGAVGTLLVSDALFKSSDFSRRKKFVKLVEDVKGFGAESVIFSSLHESGEQLNNLSGIAAILTYPLDIETVEEEERQDREDAAAAQADLSTNAS